MPWSSAAAAVGHSGLSQQIPNRIRKSGNSFQSKCFLTFGTIKTLPPTSLPQLRTGRIPQGLPKCACITHFPSSHCFARSRKFFMEVVAAAWLNLQFFGHKPLTPCCQSASAPGRLRHGPCMQLHFQAFAQLVDVINLFLGLSVSLPYFPFPAACGHNNLIYPQSPLTGSDPFALWPVRERMVLNAIIVNTWS